MKYGVLLIYFSCFQMLSSQSVIQSFDLGKSWNMDIEVTAAGASVNFIQEYKGKLLIGTEGHGLFYDGRSIGDFLPAKKVNALLAKGDEIYVSIYHHGLYRSRNLGFTWEKIYEGEVRGLEIRSDTLLIGSDEGIHLFYEDSLELVFKECQVVSIFAYQNCYVAGTSRGLLKSLDGGRSWSWLHRNGAVHSLKVIENIIYTRKFSPIVEILPDSIPSGWLIHEMNADFYDIIKVGEALYKSDDIGFSFSRDKGLRWELMYLQESGVIFCLYEKEGRLLAGLRLLDK